MSPVKTEFLNKVFAECAEILKKIAGVEGENNPPRWFSKVLREDIGHKEPHVEGLSGKLSSDRVIAEDARGGNGFDAGSADSEPISFEGMISDTPHKEDIRIEKMAAAAYPREQFITEEELNAARIHRVTGEEGLSRLGIDPEDLRKIGIDPETMEATNGTGFAAALFEVKNPDGSVAYHTLAMRGTDTEGSTNFLESLKDSEEDWKTNIKQGLGFPTGQDDQAMELARIVHNSEKVNNLVITGHSLGGQLADAARTAIGEQNAALVTYNAAGASDESIRKASDLAGDSRTVDQIRASSQKTARTYMLEGSQGNRKAKFGNSDPLTWVQKIEALNLPQPLGRQIILATPKKYVGLFKNAIARHNPPAISDAINENRQQLYG